MKKLVLYLCAGLLVLGLSACGGKPEEESSSGGGQTESSTQGSGAEDSQVSSGTESEESGADDAQIGADGWSEEMAGLRAAVVDAVGQDEYWPDMPMDGDMLNMFYSIEPELYEDYMAESPMISANVDSLVIIKAKEGQVDTVFDKLTAYRENLVNDTMQYPMNLGKIQASQVEKVGNYVIFVQLGGTAVEAESEEDVIQKCQEANQKALEAIKGKIG